MYAARGRQHHTAFLLGPVVPQAIAQPQAAFRLLKKKTQQQKLSP